MGGVKKEPTFELWVENGKVRNRIFLFPIEKNLGLNRSRNPCHTGQITTDPLPHGCFWSAYAHNSAGSFKPCRAVPNPGSFSFPPPAIFYN